MSKGKYSRKKARAKERKEQKAAQVAALRRVVNPETPTATGNHAQDPIKKKDEEPMGLRERIKGFKLSEWLLTLFTGALAVAAIYQIVITNKQLNVMRKDQRPWLSIKQEPNTLQLGVPFNGQMIVINNGKTPAKEIRALIQVETLRRDEEPTLDFPDPPNTASTMGLLVPNVPQVFPFARSRKAENGVIEPWPISTTELEEFDNADIYFTIHTLVTYTDYFGIKHWNKFCSFFVTNHRPSAFNSRKCTNYGDVDGN